MANNAAFDRNSDLIASLAMSSAFAIMVGGIGFAEQPRSWEYPDRGELIELGSLIVLSIACAFCIDIALAAAAKHPGLRVYVPGCYAAGVLAEALWFACRAVYLDPGHMNLAWECFLALVALYAAILLELATGVFLRATVWLQAGSEASDK
jgi:hypothetical protein